MKKIYTLLILFLLPVAALTVSAQEISTEGLTIETDLETVSVGFTATIDRKAAPRGVTVAYAPVITDGQYKVSLPVICVHGRGAKAAWKRHEWAALTVAAYDNAVYSRNGGTVNYTASVAFQPWMHDSRIDIETVTAGCCTANSAVSVLAHNILPEPEPEPEPEIIVPEYEPTVAELLQAAFPFVLPASEFDENEPIKFYDDERDNALTIYYYLSRYDIEPDYAGNRQTLINLIAAIDLIHESGDAVVKRVVVAGFASPEGSFEVNDRLAWERAVSVKEYIMKNTGLCEDDILLFNGSADWRGLRRMIAADENVPARREALDIIDNRPLWDARTQTGRQTLLRNLNGGRTYRYLNDHIFPKLRNGTFIRVYFETNE